MKLDSDRDTFGEALMTFNLAAMRLIAGSRKSRAGRQREPSGCMFPVIMVRALLMIALVLLLPLFMLPYLIVRIVTVGGPSVRYSSVLDVASGEPARWGYGSLEPPQDASAVRAGAAAIAAHDRGFDSSRLMNWAAAATGLICQSLTSGDATPARTFMANGLFRTYEALLEIREKGDVACEGSWRTTGARLIEARSTPLFDEVRVRLECEGWCWERHAPTGLTLRGGREPRTWSEDLTFGRSARATTPEAGGLPASRCPSCGAPLDLTRDGACRYCNGIVTAGRLDWVLIGWRREPW